MIDRQRPEYEKVLPTDCDLLLLNEVGRIWEAIRELQKFAGITTQTLKSFQGYLGIKSPPAPSPEKTAEEADEEAFGRWFPTSVWSPAVEHVARSAFLAGRRSVSKEGT